MHFDVFLLFENSFCKFTACSIAEKEAFRHGALDNKVCLIIASRFVVE
jgi:hypothetical protein